MIYYIPFITGVLCLFVTFLYLVRTLKKVRVQLAVAVDKQETSFLQGFDAGYKDGYDNGLRHKNIDWIEKTNPRTT